MQLFINRILLLKSLGVYISLCQLYLTTLLNKYYMYRELVSTCLTLVIPLHSVSMVIDCTFV